MNKMTGNEMNKRMILRMHEEIGISYVINMIMSKKNHT